jgi:hypothetical protein
MGIFYVKNRQKGGEVVNEEDKSIQLEQKIIHLKSELEKYKTMLASFQSDQQLNHLNEQIDQLTTENAQLKEKCHDYEETISTQNHEIDRLSTKLEETKKENRFLHDEIQELRSENFVLRKKVEANEEKIQFLLKDASASKQKQAELEKEKEIVEEKTQTLERELASHRSFMNEYLSFKSELQSFTSWVERIKTMEKDYDFLKDNSDKVLRDFEELKKVLFAQKTETEDLKEEVYTLTKKFRVIEERLSEIDREKQKDLLVLQKHILNQQVEMEAILEKTVRFSKEIEKISKQLSDLTERIDQKREDSSNPEINEMKEMLSQLVQLLTIQQETPLVEEKQKEITPSQKIPVIKKNTGNTISPANSFLKLHEFIDETQQSIVVSPVKKKGQNQMKPQMSNVYPQKSSQIKNVRIETQPLQPFRHKQSGEDDDKSPNPVTPTLLDTDFQEDHSDIQILTYTLDMPESTTELELSATTEEKTITSECIEEKEPEKLATHQVMSRKTEEEAHYDMVPLVYEDQTAVQEEKIDDYEIVEEMKSENQETESEHLMKDDETNVSSPIENAAASIIKEKTSQKLATHQAMSIQTEEAHYDMVPLIYEDQTAVQEEKIDDYEIVEEMKSENQETEGEHLMKDDETNLSSPIESAAASIMVVNVQETLEIESNGFSGKKIKATCPNPSAELTFHEKPVKTSLKTQDKALKNETSFLKAEDESVEEDLENKKWGFLSLLKKVKIFE